MNTVVKKQVPNVLRKNQWEEFIFNNRLSLQKILNKDGKTVWTNSIIG